MQTFIFIVACLVIGWASYWLTSKGIVAMFGKRVKVSLTDEDGVKKSTTVSYKDGDELDVILKKIKKEI
jgi:hypothetical protein